MLREKSFSADSHLYCLHVHRFTLPMLVVLAADLGTGHFLWVGGAVVSGMGIRKFSSLKGGHPKS